MLNVDIIYAFIIHSASLILMGAFDLAASCSLSSTLQGKRTNYVMWAKKNKLTERLSKHGREKMRRDDQLNYIRTRKAQ